MRGRLQEDPILDVAVTQFLGTDCPNVVKSIRVLKDDDRLYSFIPFYKDGDLFARLVQYAESSGGEAGMPENVARFWFRQVLQSFLHLHSKGVCYRDMSLENFMINDDSLALTDMGLCLRIPYNHSTDPNQTTDIANGSIRRLILPQGTCGKANYLCPEIFENQDAFDPCAIDMWGTGVVLYILLCGFPPYDTPSLGDARFEVIVNGQLIDQLQEWGIHLSEQAGDLLQRLLHCDPKHRLTLAQALEHPWVCLEELERPLVAIAAGPVSSASSSSREELDQLAVSVNYLQTQFLEELSAHGLDRSSNIYAIENLQGPPGVLRKKGKAVFMPS
ncbi:MAP kinase-activated protein kinase 2 (Fragment) [Seminavis robusta]|uniref:MAP kinase-activated protein kinase 2 n=1 Tax=Seminavis robusta TaxID=568900 RepID=A0A9N8EJV8_9STRA